MRVSSVFERSKLAINENCSSVWTPKLHFHSIFYENAVLEMKSMERLKFWRALGPRI